MFKKLIGAMKVRRMDTLCGDAHTFACRATSIVSPNLWDGRIGRKRERERERERERSRGARKAAQEADRREGIKILCGSFHGNR
jgi:hypothetical protein